VCSLTLSETTQEQLESIGGNGANLEKLMKRRAFDANVNQPGLYDQPSTNLRAGFAEDLRQSGVRKERIMGHRIYFVGNHSDCNYTAFFIKFNKKGDDENQDDNNSAFHEKLRRALAGKDSKTLEDPKEIAIAEQENVEKKPAWQKAEWYKEYGG
jgi:hypothetical protein